MGFQRTGPLAAAAIVAVGCVNVTRDEEAIARLRDRREPVCLERTRIELAAPVSLPLLEDFGLPSVTAQTPGGPCTLLLDSGSQFCLLRPALADRLNLPVSGELKLSLLGEAFDSLVACMERLSVGAIRCEHLPFVLSPGHVERHAAGITMERIDGVLGMPFLHRFATTVDFRRKLVTFTPLDSYVAPEGPTVRTVPLRFLPDGRPCVTAAIDGGRPLLFLLDTGARRCVVRRELAEDLPDLGSVRLLSLGVALDATLTELPTVDLGPIVLERVPAYVLPGGQRSALRYVDGFIGIDVFRGFSFTMDPWRQRLVLER